MVPYSPTTQNLILSSLYLPFSYAPQLSQTYKHSFLLIASAAITERHMKMTFSGSHFTKLLYRQDNSSGNKVQWFVFISLSPLATGWAKRHPAYQPRWAQRHTQKDCYSICWLDSSSGVQPLNSLQGKLCEPGDQHAFHHDRVDILPFCQKWWHLPSPTLNPQTQTQIQLENTEPRITGLIGAGSALNNYCFRAIIGTCAY